MDIKNLVLSDEALSIIDNGTWVGGLPGVDGVELLVCGMEAKEAREAMNTAQAQARMENEGKPLTNEQLAACTRSVLADVVLKGWRGLTSGGAPVEYSKSTAKQWLTSRNGERFAGLTLVAAQRVDMLANDFAEAAKKNSSPV